MARPAKLRKTPGQARSKQTVEAIIEAGARILVDDGYARLTTNKVAELAGVSIGSLYQYFANKDALILAIHERHQARVRAAMSSEFDPAFDLASLAGLRRLIAAVVCAHQVEPMLHARFESLRQEGSLPDGLNESELSKIAEKLEAMLQAGFGRDIEDTRLSSRVMVTVVAALMHSHERGDLHCSIDRLVDEIALVVSGYVTAGQNSKQ